MYLKPLTNYASNLISGGKKYNHQEDDMLLSLSIVIVVNILFLYLMRMIWNNQCVTYFNLPRLPNDYMGLLDLVALSLMCKFLLA